MPCYKLIFTWLKDWGLIYLKKEENTYSECKLVQTREGFNLARNSARFRGELRRKSAKLSLLGDFLVTRDVAAGGLSKRISDGWASMPAWEKQGWFRLVALGLSSGVSATSGSSGPRCLRRFWNKSFRLGIFSPTSSMFSFLFLEVVTAETDLFLFRFLPVWMALCKGEANGDGFIWSSWSNCGHGRSLGLLPTAGVLDWRFTSDKILLIDWGGGSQGE